jgi:hypothetical protein
MKSVNKITQKGFLVIITIMIMTIPNFRVYSSVGTYSSSSISLNANNEYGNTILAKPPKVWLPMLAAAGLGVVFAVGVIDGWNSIGNIMAPEPDYNKNDFSKFDN